MSTFDLSKIVDSLQSAKIKQRNDALNLLDGFSPSKLRLNARQFVLLANGLLTLVEIEKSIYASNATNATIARLSKASSFLKDLLEECLKLRSLRYKHCLPLATKIIAIFFLENGVVGPCVVDFALILSQLLAQEFFTMHLSAEVWAKLFRFLVKLIETALEDSGHVDYSHESLLTDLYASLVLVVGANCLYVQNSTPLLPLLRRTLEVYSKRETQVLIHSFKVINRLLVVMLTEDFSFVHEVIKIALKSFLHFSATSIEPLQLQFVVFLNLDSVHRYMSISHLPRLIGDNFKDSETLDVLLYNVGILVQSLLTRLQSQPLKLRPEDIGVFDGPLVNWFVLSTVYLKTNNPTLWLSFTGLTKLIASYYRLRSDFSNIVLDEGSGQSFSRNSYKRQKLQGRTPLLACNNILQLLNEMINDASDSRTQICGLQLLCFHLEQNGILDCELPKIVDDSETTLNPDESTILDINFDSDPTDGFSHIVVFTSIIKVLNNASLTHWALYSCHSLLRKFPLRLDNPTLARRMHQLIKVLLPLVKEKDYFQLACSTFSYIVFQQSTTDVHCLVDKSILAQIENIVDLSEIGGPPMIDDFSFKFWWAVTVIVNNVNSVKKADIANSVGRWFLAKWSDMFVNTENGIQRYSGMPLKAPHISKFLQWIGGKKDIDGSGDTIPESYFGTLTDSFVAMKQHEQLQKFLALEEENVPIANVTLVLPMIQGNPYVVNTLIDRVYGIATMIANTDEDVMSTVMWAKNLTVLASEMKDSHLLHDKARQLWQSLALMIVLREQALQVVSFLLSEDLPRSLLECFPFQALNCHFHTQRVSSIPERTSVYDALLDSEFSSGEEPKRQLLVRGDRIPGSVDYFKFLVRYETTNVDSHILFMESLCPEDVLSCLEFYLKQLDNSWDLKPASCVRLVRLLGEGPLSSHYLDRSDLTIATVCELLEFLMPLPKNEALQKDYMDLVNFILQCGEKLLLLTEESQIKLWNFALAFLRFNDNLQYTNAEVTRLFFKNFESFPNRIKISMTDSVSKHFELLEVFDQMLFYRELFTRFAQPQESVESSAAYCLFFCSVSKGQSQLRISALFNLIECSRFEFFVPYLKLGIGLMGSSFKVDGPRQLFKMLKMELLKCWWNYKHDILEFPFLLFGYHDLQTFLTENYREVVSVLIAIKDEGKGDRATSLIEYVAKVKGSDTQSLICDSLPLIVPLAYTSDGIRNNVFKSLTASLGELYKGYMREKLLLIILETVRYTDAKSELALNGAIGDPLADSLFTSDFVCDTSMQTLVSPQSSVDLVEALVAKYWAYPKADFWSSRTVYFLTRQVGKGIILNSKEVRLLSLRKLKLVLSWNRSRVTDIELAQLLADVCCPLIGTDLSSDAVSILSMINLDSFVDSAPNACVVLLIQILGRLLANPAEGLDLIQNLQCICAAQEEKMGSALPLIKAALQCLNQEEVVIQITSVETFLEDPTFQKCFELDSRRFLQLFSELLPFIKMDRIQSTSLSTVKLFMKFDSGSGTTKEFDLWVSKYLSYHYLSGAAHEEIARITGKKEYQGLNKSNFSARVSSMECFFEIVFSYLKDEDYEVVAFVESILGALIWKFENRKSDFLKFLDFEAYYKSLSKYLTPLDFHSCVLINSDFEDFRIMGTSLDSFVSNFLDFTSESFKTWTSQLLLAIIQEVARYTSVASLFASFVLKVSSVAKLALPSFICFFISLTGESGAEKVSKLIRAYCRSFKRPYCLESIELFSNIVLHLRVGAKAGLDIFSEIYSKLEHEKIFMIIKESNLSKTSLMIFEDSIGGKFENVNWPIHRLVLADIYNSIDDEDLLYGLPEDATLGHALRMIERVGESSEKVKYNSGLLDASMTWNGTGWERKMLHSMLNDGLMGVSKILSTGMNSDSDTYEWGWKLNLWDIPVTDKTSGEHEVIYSYFKRIQDNPVLKTAIYEDSMVSLLNSKKQLQQCDLSVKQYRTGVLNWLKTLATISTVDSVLNTNPEEFDILNQDFQSITSWFESAETNISEDIILARRHAFYICGKLSMASSNFISPNKDICWQGVAKEIARHCDIVRVNNQLQKLVNSTILLDKFVGMTSFSDPLVQESLQRLSTYQAARTLWSEGKTSVPVAMLKELEKRGSIEFPLTSLGVHDLLIKAMLVKWLAESRQELGTTVLSQYVDPMKDQIRSVQDIHQRAKIYHLLAHFCELEYKSHGLNDQIKMLGQRAQNKKSEIEEIKSHYGKTSVTANEKKSVQKYYNRLKSQVLAETSELGILQDKRNHFASNAVKFYLKVLLLDDTEEEDLDRFLTLFLELSNDEILQSAIKEDLVNLSSFKSLAWCTQLMARLSHDRSVFQNSVQKLIFKICHDHPFHTLYLLISLMNHDKVAQETANAGMISRVKAAKAIREMLLASEFSNQILLPIEKLCEEIVQLAELKSSKGRTLHLDKLKIGHFFINELPNVPPPTMHIPVSKAGYSKTPRMVSIDPKVGIATSGLSLPKIADFTLSDGSRHKMLLKHGTDDLRQDATMEQVFEKVNNIFLKDGETRKRRLRVRTYKAVPLGPKAGAIEFVPNSRALIEVIRPFHQRFDKLKSDRAREMMKECQTDDTRKRLEVYAAVTTKIQPVLRHFFLETFVTPDTWFESRQVYTRGIATTSMVGHILGLGDRHCNNILLDENTGEPVHIDLGVAFDQGKRLPIPETVPFRLTRDIVDGFGFTGVNGSFNKLSEHTFRVLRLHKDHILAILDVLRWDPLYSWSISPIRKGKLQDGNTEIAGLQPQEDGSEAGSAVLTVIDKLNAGGLSVEATVRELIREATSVNNLAVIYCGWCPFF